MPLIYIILAKYAVACTITIFAKDDFCCVAWDSAGKAGSVGRTGRLGQAGGAGRGAEACCG